MYILTSKPRPDLHVSDTNFEQCMAEIILKKHKLLVGSLYRPLILTNQNS